MINKHENSDNNTDTSSKFSFTVDTIRDILHNTAQKIRDDNIYEKKNIITFISNVISSETCSMESEQLEHLVKVVNKMNFKSVEKFQMKYLKEVVNNSKDFYPKEDYRASRLLLMKFLDLFFTTSIHSKKTLKEIEAAPKNLTERELSGLQYLGGYVIHKTLKKLKGSSKQDENIQAAISALECCKSPLDSENQKLTAALNRGGLCFISKQTQQIFTISERYFRLKTAKVNIRHINIDAIINELVNYPYIKSLFDEIVEASNIKIQKSEIKKTTLCMIIELFVKVRSSSLAKDVVEKYRSNKVSSKDKSLQANLKHHSSAGYLHEDGKGMILIVFYSSLVGKYKTIFLEKMQFKKIFYNAIY